MSAYLGEFEQLLLLAVLRRGAEAFAARHRPRARRARGTQRLARRPIHIVRPAGGQGTGSLEARRRHGAARRAAAARLHGHAGRTRRAAHLARSPSADVARSGRRPQGTHIVNPQPAAMGGVAAGSGPAARRARRHDPRRLAGRVRGRSSARPELATVLVLAPRDLCPFATAGGTNALTRGSAAIGEAVHDRSNPSGPT